MTRDSSARPESEVRVRVLARATQGGELAEGEWTAFAGEVVAADEPSVAVGTRVAGFGAGRTDEIRVPAWAVAAAPADLPVETAALLPLAGVAVRAARLVGATAGGQACVVGSGPLAELVADALRSAGAGDVAVLAAPGEALPPIVVDTTGDPAVIARLLEGAPRLGHVALAGASRGRTVDVDFYRTVHQRGLEVVGIHDFGPLSELSTAEDRASDLAAAATLLARRRGLGTPAERGVA